MRARKDSLRWLGEMKSVSGGKCRRRSVSLTFLSLTSGADFALSTRAQIKPRALPTGSSQLATPGSETDMTARKTPS
jgi:hypothetical protein